MKSGPALVWLVLTLGGPAWAKEPEAAAPATPAPSLESLKGRYAFNQSIEPSKTKCVPITAKMIKGFAKNYRCDLEEKDDSASGAPHVTCAHQKNEAKVYTVFKTRALCDDERETQAANSEEP